MSILDKENENNNFEEFDYTVPPVEGEVVAEEVAVNLSKEETSVFEEVATETVTCATPEYIAAPNETYNAYAPVNTEGDGLCIASLVLGIVAFFFNPFYVPAVLAIVFGAVGMGKNSSKQSMAKAGLICGVSALAWQFLLDLLLTIFSFGMGGVSFCC